MTSIKSFLNVVSQLIIIETFINAKALGKSVVNTGFCPTSSQTGGSTWLLYGMPPKCYVAGLKGPCEFNQVLLPKSQDSNYGQCMSSSSYDILIELNSQDGKQDISQKLESYNRIKRQIIPSHAIGEAHETSSGHGIPRGDCPVGTVWSEIRKRCIQNFNCSIC
ncbi:unnamed protein product [Orchesella dallaii]|uniref:Secreted protein n=1 Tax=Orchesella dallaii TaxID=48710 RepID=A0ABP1PM58_9HEXA